MSGSVLLLASLTALAADAPAEAAAAGPAEPVVVVLALDPVPRTDRPECLSSQAPVSCAYRLRFARPVPGAPNEDRLRTVESRLLIGAFDDVARAYETHRSPAGALLRDSWGGAFPPTDALWTTGGSALARPPGEDGPRLSSLRIHTHAGGPAARLEVGPAGAVHVDPCGQAPARSSVADGIWQRLRYQLPCTRDPMTGERVEDAELPSPMVLLDGRFAERMAADERPLPVDIMGTDLDSGAAFLEEMFPVSKASWDAGVRTLDAFQQGRSEPQPTSCGAIGPSGRPLTRLVDTDRACLERVASAHMQQFEADVFHQLQRFAIPTAPPVAPRVLGALAAMSAPPGAIPELQPISFAQLVSSSRGQLDPDELRARPSIEPIPNASLRIHYSALPPFVLWEGLAEVARYTAERTEAPLRQHLDDRRIELFGAPSTGAVHTTLPPLDRRAAADWIRASGIPPSRQPDAFAAYPAAALHELVEVSGLVDERSRDRFREWLFYQHLRHELYPLRSPDPEVLVTAGDIEQATMGILATVAATHGVPITAVDQTAAGTVDPLAVCTTTDGQDSLAEPLQAVVTVDQLFALPAHGELTEDPLWAVRGDLPFVALDDPARRVSGRPLNAPTVEKILELPGNVGVFRARWTVWAGWHLLWNVEERDGVDQVIGRTAAICEDTVLVPEPLLPTLVWEVLGRGAHAAHELEAEETQLREQTLGWLTPILEEPLRELSDDGGATLAVVVEKAYTDRPTRSLFGSPVGPSSLARARARDGRHRFVEGRSTATVLPADPALEAVNIAPAHVLRALSPPPPPPGTDAAAAEAGAASDTASSAAAASPAPTPSLELPERWHRSTSTEPWLDAGVLGDASIPPNGPLAVSPGLNLNTGMTVWGLGRPTRGLTFGVGGTLTSLPDSPKVELSTDTSVGVRFAPIPLRARRPARRLVAWGDDKPGGGRAVGRTQLGGRVGWQLAADETDGVAHAVWVEPWMAWSVHPSFTARGTLSPYSPGALFGPSVRLQVEPNFEQQSIDAVSLIVALRTWWLLPRAKGGKK